MEFDEHTRRLSALAHPGRLAVFRLVSRHAPATVRPGDMIEALGLKPNTLSVYLGALTDAGLLDAERHGTAIHYRASPDAIGALVDFLVADCCRGRPDVCAPLTADALARTSTGGPYSVLFVCTGNSTRSIFAEAILRDLGGFVAYSAGTAPRPAIHPRAAEVLARNGHDIATLHTASISTFQGADAPQMDFVFTVCDRAANEECPPWLGQPLSSHWSIADPAGVTGTEAEVSFAFADCYAQIRRRVAAFAALPIDSLDRLRLQREIDTIGALENA